MWGRYRNAWGIALSVALLAALTLPVAEAAAGGRVVGFVFDDIDGDGVRDSGEPRIDGVTVALTDALGTSRSVITTATSPYVIFGAAGTAELSVDLLPGYVFTTANNPQPVEVILGGAVSAAAVGMQADSPAETGSLRGNVFADINESGQREAGEPGLGGLGVSVVDSGGAVHAASTAGNGTWTLNGLPVGSATITVTGPVGYGLTTANNPQSKSVTSGGTAIAARVGFAETTTTAVAYTDVAAAAGVDEVHEEGNLCAPRTGSGSAWADFDGDGDQDLYVTNRGGANHLYRNDGDTGTDGVPDFVDIAVSAGADFAADASLGAVFIDFDNDGDQDLFVTHWGGNTLLKNMLNETGTATLTDISAGSGLTDGGRAITASWGDYDNDGFLDVYLSKHISCAGMAEPTDRLFHNDAGTGSFTDVTSNVLCGGADPVLACPDVNGIAFTAGWFDYDRDGDLDLYVVNDDINGEWQPNKMWQNNGADGLGGWLMSEVGAATGTNISLNGMGLGVGDYNNDGWLDLAFSNGEPAKLLLNDTQGAFTDVSDSSGVTAATTGITWGTTFVDYDNNQTLDLFFAAGEVATADPRPDFFLENDGAGNFTDIAPAIGMNHLGTGRNASLADFDDDGWVDIWIGNIGQAPGLMQNRADELGNTNHWLTVTVEGTDSNADAIGTQVWLTTPDATQLRLISSGPTHGGGDQKAAFFGLGTNATGELTIEWPNGTTEVIGTVTADQKLHYTEPASG